MKPIKVFIISLNELPTSYWHNTLQLSDVDLWHWKCKNNALNNISTIWPDIILVDAYFSKKGHLDCLKKVLEINCSAEIFCLTPLPKNFIGPTIYDPRLVVSKLDLEVIEQINKSIRLNKSGSGIEKIA